MNWNHFLSLSDLIEEDFTSKFKSAFGFAETTIIIFIKKLRVDSLGD